MKARSAFTLLELLISITLSCLVAWGLVQAYDGLIRYIENVRDMLGMNRNVCLLLSQMEKDLSSAYIPFLSKEDKQAGQGEKPETALSAEQKKQEEEKELAQRRNFFVANVDETSVGQRIDGKRMDLFKSVSLICTNPFEVFGEKRVRLVRVVYQLVLNKAKSKSEQPAYQLLRNETFDLSNVKGKVDEFGALAPGKTVRSYVVADDIKSMYVQYSMLEKDIKKEEKKQEGAPAQEVAQKKDKNKELKASVWGKTKDLSGVVPRQATIWLDVWNEKKSLSVTYKTVIPIFAYPTPDEKEKEKKEEQKNEKATQQKVGEAAQSGQQPTPSQVPAQQPQAAPEPDLGSLMGMGG